MAVRYKKQYTNQSEYLYDQAKSTGRFDEDTYNILLGSGEGDNYAQAVANTKYMTSDTFDEQEYALLSGEDKYAYLMNEYYVDKSSEQYSQNKAYLDEEIQKAIDAKTYDSLNGFQKFMSTLGGIVGNALNELVLGTVEGLIDVSLLAAGAVTGTGDTAKELIAQDTTGVAANRKSLEQFARAYTFIDKNGFFKGVNDVVTGITKMAPLAINIVVPGVGTGVYFAGMAGNTAEEAVIANPDIDYGSLLAYTAAVTGVEFATEKISSLVFGGSAIDSLMFKSTGSKAGSWISRIGIDFLSEGMEESVAEFADSVLYTALVDKNAPLASFGEVLYAGLIGGIIGGIGAGGRVLGTKRVAITEDGRLVQYDKNDKSFEGKVLGKAQSLTLQERIQNAKSSLDKSAVTDLRAKYKSKDLETIKKEHADEYQKAVEKDTKFQNEVTEAAVALSKILDLIGDTSFAKATELANYTIEQTQNLLYNYLNKTTATDVANRVVENKFAIKNPGSSLKINDALTTTQQRLKDAVKQKYDKNVYFGEIGTADGIEKKHGLTLDEKTIVIDSRITETMSLDNLIENVVKEELSHALQYDSGVITAQTIKDLNEQFVGIGGVTAEIKNRYEYNRKKNLTKISENQAKFLAESLLFDELTVAKVFITNNSTFNSVYKWLISRKDAIERKKNKKTNKDKVEYRVLLKTMDTYRKTVAEKIGNEEDAATAAAEMNLTDEQLQKLLDTYLPDYSNEHYTLLGKNYTIHTQRRMTAEKTLSENRKTINLLFPLSYKMIYNPEYYKDEFVKDILSRNPDKDFRYNLQEYMINTFGFTINMADECLMEVVDYNKVITSEFDSDMSDLVANPTALDKYDSADKIFKDTFKNKFGDSLSNVKIKFVKTTQNQSTKAKYVRMDPITKLPTITVYMKENSTLTPAQTSALRHAVFHEMTHALSDIQGLQNGTSTNYVKSALLEIDDINVINKLSTILLTKKYRTENANNQRAIIDALAYGIYRITDGEYAAESYPQSSTREGDLKVALKAGATMNRSGFRTDGRVLYGYGRFKGIDLEAKTITQSKLEYDIEGLKSATEVVSYSLENKLLKHLQELGVQDYEEAGFDDRFITDILDNPEATVNDVWNKVNSNSVGDKKATNIIIKWLAPNNKTMKTIDDVEKVTKGNGLAYGYLFRKNVLKKTPDYDADKPHSFQEIENRIVDLMSKSDKNITLVTNTIERVADKLDRPENSTINKLLITSDFDYSLNAINKLYATISGEHGISSELKTEGIEITTNEGSDVDIAASESPYGVELSPEEIKIREEERAEDKRTVKDRIDSAVNEVKKSLETWLTTDQQNAWKGDDRNEVKALKKILSEVEKSELSGDPDITSALTDIKSGKIFKDVVQNIMTDDNAFSIKNKINRNSSELKNLFGEDFLKTSGLKDILPQNKSNYVKMINKQRTRLKDAKLTEKQQKDLIERDLSEINSPNEFENILTRLKEIKTPESIDKQSKITTDKKNDTITENKQKTETVKEKKQNPVAKSILDNYKNATQGISEAQFFDETDMSYERVGYSMIEDNAALFSAINDENYDEIRNEIKSDTNFYSDQALVVFDLYTLEMIGKFSPEIQNKIRNYNRRELTKSAQKLALQSKRVANKKPVTNIINQLESSGYKVNIPENIIAEYDAKLKNKDARIKELSDEINRLETQLKNTENKLEQQDLLREIKEASDEKTILENGSVADILDMIVSREDLETGSKILKDLLSKFLDISEKAEATNKNVGYYMYDKNGKPVPFPELSQNIAKILQKARAFRMWSMLSSPVTWVRNWIGNQMMRVLDKLTNVFERFITSKTDFASHEMKYNETKAGKAVYDHIAETHGTYIQSLVKGEVGKYSDEKMSDSHRAQIAEIKEKQISDEQNTFRKLILKASRITEIGLEEGPLGDQPIMINSICKNMGDLVASNIDFLLIGIRNEQTTLSSKKQLTPKQKERLSVLNKALETKNAVDVFSALSSEELTRLFDNAKQRAAQQYFKNQNNLNKWFTKFGAKHPLAAELVSWVMPFPKVAVNILSMAYRYSPAGLIRSFRLLSTYKQISSEGYKGPTTGFEKAEVIRSYSENAVGTVMMIAGAIASLLGWIDIDEDDYMGPCLTFGSFKISLSQLAPSMTAFSTAAAMTWAWKNNKSGVSEALNVIYDNTLLGNVENIFRYSSPEKYMENLSISYISQYIPAVLKLVNKTVFQSSTKDKSGPYLIKVAKTLGSYIPGVSELVPNKIDPYTGKKVYASGSDNWFLNFIAGVSPINISYSSTSKLEHEAERLNTKTTGLSGTFTINGNDLSVTNRDKEKLAKYRAKYLETRFENIVSGKEKITIENDSGKRITTTYNKLTDAQKTKVLKRLYTEASEMSKIKHWVESGNKYISSNRDEYNEYRKLFGSNILYRQKWSKSKFVEG